MEQALLGLFSTSFLVFTLVIAISVIAVRRLVEAICKKIGWAIPDKIENAIAFIWREWILKGLPILLGGVFAYCFSQYPFPAEFAGSDSGRVFFGIIAGLVSSSAYSFVKIHLNKYLPESMKQKLKLPTQDTQNTPDNVSS